MAHRHGELYEYGDRGVDVKLISTSWPSDVWWSPRHGDYGGHNSYVVVRDDRGEFKTQSYAQAILLVAGDLYRRHGLDLRPHGRERDLKIVPQATWEDAAEKIRQTMNGVGIFHFGSLGDFLRSGPYTARQAVLGHLRTITDWPLVREGRRASRLVEERMR